MFGRVLARGDIGLAEAYLDGLWDSPDITGLLTLLARNRDALRQGRLWLVAEPAGRPRPALAQPQQPHRQPAQHHGPLRSGQRFLQALAGPEHELLGSDLPRRQMTARWKPPSTPSTAASCSA
jgi:hypothetical protein